jgi:hypothetical protein
MKNNFHVLILPVVGALLISSCGKRDIESQTDRNGIYTLYESPTSGSQHRNHVATFDATIDLANVTISNRSNCEITSLLFNANLKAEAGGERLQAAGFWCEPGRYSAPGQIPTNFKGRFPLDL